MDYGLDELRWIFRKERFKSANARVEWERTWRINLLIATRILRKRQREILLYGQPVEPVQCIRQCFNQMKQWTHTYVTLQGYCRAKIIAGEPAAPFLLGVCFLPSLRRGPLPNNKRAMREAARMVAAVVTIGGH